MIFYLIELKDKKVVNIEYQSEDLYKCGFAIFLFTESFGVLVEASKVN